MMKLIMDFKATEKEPKKASDFAGYKIWAISENNFLQTDYEGKYLARKYLGKQFPHRKNISHGEWKLELSVP